MIKRPKPGASGWIGVAAVIVLAEILDSKTMSKFFHETAQQPLYGPVMAAGYIYLGLHLFGMLPEKYDAFKQLGNAASKAARS